MVDACPLCRSPLHTTILRKPPFELRRCAPCGLAYRTPRPGPEIIEPGPLAPQGDVDRRLDWALRNGPAGGRALDAGPGVAELARRGFRVTRGWHGAPETDFDVICLWDGPERVADPVGLLARARRALGPGGRLVVSTTDVDSPVARAMGRRWPRFRHSDRLQYFYRATTERLLTGAGLTIERTTHHLPARRLDPRDRMLTVALGETRWD